MMFILIIAVIAFIVVINIISDDVKHRYDYLKYKKR